MKKKHKFIIVFTIFFSLNFYVNAKDNNYKLETLYDGLDMPWDVDFLPNGDFLISELTGKLKIYNPSLKTLTIVSNLPSVLVKSQGGLSDIELHPDFETNNLIYFSYSIKTNEGNTLRVSRAKLLDNALSKIEVIFTANAFRETSAHYGARLLFLNDSTLLISSGDGFNHREKAQYLDNHFGKIVRINDDGTIPGNNPFSEEDKALKDIFTYGHRNQQGLTKDINGIIYSHEHGPKGGDELNIINPGLNYGWPAITYGIDYSGSIISPFKRKEGMEQPIKYWTPSIAVSDMTFYYGDLFPEWYGNLFISALSPGDVRKLVISDNKVVSEDIMFKEIGSRIRSIKSSNNGDLIGLRLQKANQLMFLNYLNPLQHKD